MTKIRMMVALGGALALAGCIRLLWFLVPDREMTGISVVTIYLVGLADSVAGLWRNESRALIKSRILAVAAFVFGCYITNFAWSFWLFQEPTLKDRILAVLKPEISLYLIVPILWLVLSFLPGIRSKFQS